MYGFSLDDVLIYFYFQVRTSVDIVKACSRHRLKQTITRRYIIPSVTHTSASSAVIVTERRITWWSTREPRITVMGRSDWGGWSVISVRRHSSGGITCFVTRNLNTLWRIGWTWRTIERWNLNQRRQTEYVSILSLPPFYLHNTTLLLGKIY